MILFRYILIYFILVFLHVSAIAEGNMFQPGALNQNFEDTIKNDTNKIISFEAMIDSLIFYAEKSLGTRYRYGGNSKLGFDCSGFTSYVFANFGIDLPRSSRDQALKGMPLEKKDIKRGDLVFFKGRNMHSNIIGHVGLVVENLDTTIRFIHASRKKGICYDYTTTDYYRVRYIGAKRIIGEDITDSLWADFSNPEIEVEDTSDIEIETDSLISANIESDKNKTADIIKQYVVRRGDTLYSIAKRNNTTVENIMEKNKLKSDKIYPGQKLKL